MDKQVVISIKTILFTFLMALVGYVFYRLSSLFGLLFVALLIVISIEPLILYLMKKRLLGALISRNLSVVLSYLLVVIVLLGILTIGIPPVISQFKKMIFIFVDFLNSLNINGGFDKYVSEAVAQISGVSGGVITTTLSIFENIATLFSLLVISIYISLDWLNIKKRLFSLFPRKVQEDAQDTISEIETNIGEWIKGQLFLMLVIGVVSFLGLFVLGVDYAIALGLISGLLEFVPMIGPLISAVLAGVIGFSMSPVKGFGVIILFTLIQQLENNLLVPKIMQKVSGFSPLIILFALLIGSEFFGVVGALVAVPLTMIGSILVKKALAINTRR